VEYQLTDMGSSLIPPLKTLCLWAEAHAEGRGANSMNVSENPRKCCPALQTGQLIRSLSRRDVLEALAKRKGRPP